MSPRGPRFHERLLPGIGAAIVLAGLIALLSIAFGAALGALVGWLIALGLALATGMAIYRGAPTVVVDETGLHAEGATLPWIAIGPAQALDRQQARQARGPGAVASRFTVLRTWHAATAVLVEVRDPADPHPAWLLSTRRPEALVTALASSAAPENTP